MSEDTKNTEHNYWLVGYWGNKKDEFISQGKWEDGNSQEDIDKLKQVNVGDYLVLKSNITTGPNHSLSSTKIYAIGIVNKKNEDLTFYVNWYTRNLPETLPYSSFGGGGKARIANIDHIKISEKVKKYIEENIDPMKTICSKLLKESHNIILHGAPGTGKTYLAKQIAYAMGAETEFVQFHPSYDYTDFVEGLRPVNKEGSKEIGFERKDGIFKKFCKKALLSTFINTVDNFEDSWKNLCEILSNKERIDIPLIKDKTKTIKIELNSFEDGLRSCEESPKFFNREQLYKIYKGLPGVPSGGHDTYRKAIVKYMKEKCGLKDYNQGEQKVSDKKFVFIIDEINRGELSKIFGELFFSIDPGYRGKKGTVKTQYQNLIENDDDFYNGFYVPENVYIIGTMNDIDRNVESMDFAIRRRFAFMEITAAETKGMLDNPESWNGNQPPDDIIGKMKNRMDNLNKAISGIEGLSSAYHIGASYFLKFNLPSETIENEDPVKKAFDNLWNYHLKPLLQEYLRGMEDEAGKMNILKAAYNLEKIYNEKGEEVKNNTAKQ